MVHKVTRRRFLTISAFAAAAAVAPARGAEIKPTVWQGRAMGTDATITLHHPQPAIAEKLLVRCRDEIARLESQLSLFQPDSSLCRLNRDGVILNAPDALLEVLRVAGEIHLSTDGAFDITVQPLWQLYAGHFSRRDADPLGPSADAIAAARMRTGAHHLHIQGRNIRLARPDMAVTLNGIAQGYVTDRIAHLLRTAGMDNVLLDLGEFHALGPHPSGRAWNIGLRDPSAPWRILENMKLTRGAVATSGGYGTPFDASGKFHHLFDPATGLPAQHYRSLSIMGPDATRADALSTGLSALPLVKATAMLRSLGPAWSAIFVTTRGTVHHYNYPVG